jgi:hypothetical protein
MLDPDARIVPQPEDAAAIKNESNPGLGPSAPGNWPWATSLTRVSEPEELVTSIRQGATAKNAMKPRTTLRGPADEPGRRPGYRPSCGNGSSTRSMPASRSGRCSVTLA